MRKLTPQEKKALSYARDRRNDYGGNDKASRESIRQNKTLPARAYRKTVSDILRGAIGAVDLAQAESADVKTREIKRRKWRKYPDKPLGKIVARQLENRKKHAGKGKTARKKTREFVANLKIEVVQETDGRWLAKAIGLKDITAYGVTAEKAIERCKTIAGYVYFKDLDAGRILEVNDDYISVLTY